MRLSDRPGTFWVWVGVLVVSSAVIAAREYYGSDELTFSFVVAGLAIGQVWRLRHARRGDPIAEVHEPPYSTPNSVVDRTPPPEK